MTERANIIEKQPHRFAKSNRIDLQHERQEHAPARNGRIACPATKHKQETIADLQKELAKGEAVYSREELSRLELKLADYEQMLRSLIER